MPEKHRFERSFFFCLEGKSLKTLIFFTLFSNVQGRFFFYTIDSDSVTAGLQKALCSLSIAVMVQFIQVNIRLPKQLPHLFFHNIVQ